MKLKKFLSLTVALMMCASLFAVTVVAESVVTLENISATKSEITLDYSAAVFDGAFTLTHGGEKVAASVTKTNNGKTVVITPENEFELDKTYVIHSTGVSDESGEKVDAYYKAFKLEKLFSDDFSYENISDMDSVWKVSYKSISSVYSVSGYNDYAGKTVYGLEKGWLTLNGNSNNAVINVQSSDLTKWNKYTLEFDIKRDGGTRYYTDIFYHMTRDNGKPNDYRGIFRLGLWDAAYSQAAAYFLDCNDYGHTTATGVFVNDLHHLKFTTKTGKDLQVFKDGTNVFSRTYGTSFGNGEIGFRIIGGSYKQYIDNVLAYKLVMLSEIPDIATPAVTGDFEVGKAVVCSVAAGDEITGSFNALYQWYRGDDYFADEWELIENAESQSYTITEADVSKYLFCKVTFIHNTESDFKILLESEPAHAPLPPVARNYKLTYNKDDNSVETLTVNYEYFDANNDEKINETFVWEESSTGEENSWTPLSEASGTYVIQSTDINKYIRCTLTVENDNSETSEPVTEVYILPFSPTEKDGIVTISGLAVVGETLTADYDYFDNNGDEEGNSERNWYRVDSFGNRILVASGSTAYGVKSEDCGLSIQFGYKPISKVYPENGTEIFSNKIDIPAIVVNAGGGYTGGFSGGGGSSVTVSKPAPKEEEIKEPQASETVKEPQDTKTDIGTVFSDMKTHWSKEYVSFLYEKGIVNGRGDGYCPEDKVTRAEWVTMLLRLIEKDGQGSYDNCFSDVNANDWYAKDIQTAFSLGIISGSDNGFMPNESITREQLAKIAIDAYELVKGETEEKDDLSKFTDSKNVSEWAVSHMEKAIKLGVINGMTDNSLSPKNTATRAEAAAVLSRVYNLISSK